MLSVEIETSSKEDSSVTEIFTGKHVQITQEQRRLVEIGLGILYSYKWMRPP